MYVVVCVLLVYVAPVFHLHLSSSSPIIYVYMSYLKSHSSSVLLGGCLFPSLDHHGIYYPSIYIFVSAMRLTVAIACRRSRACNHMSGESSGAATGDGNGNGGHDGAGDDIAGEDGACPATFGDLNVVQLFWQIVQKKVAQFSDGPKVATHSRNC